MLVYGAPICVNCQNFKRIAEKRNIQYEYVDITKSTANLKEFLAIRDHHPLFKEVKEKGAIGIPLFVNEDSQLTLDLNEALAWLNQPPVTYEELEPKCDGSCSLF